MGDEPVFRLRGAALLGEVFVSVEKWYILAIDQAERSGWAVVEMPDLRLVASGVASNHLERTIAVARACELAGDCPLRVIFEDHSDIPARSGFQTATLLGMGAARGHWETSLAIVGVKQAHFAHKATSKAWRWSVFRKAGGSTEQWKDRAIKWASAFAKRPIADHNEAEAICLAAFGGRNVPQPRATKKRKAA